MKAILFCFSIFIFSSVSNGKDVNVFVGVLSQASKGAEKCFPHNLLFQNKSGLWKEFSAAKSKYPETIQATYDGKDIGELGALKENQTPIFKSAQKLKVEAILSKTRAGSLVTTTRKGFSDPEGWWRVKDSKSISQNTEFKSAQMKLLSKIKLGCPGKPFSGTKGWTLQFLFKPQKGNRLLTALKNESCEQLSAAEKYDSGNFTEQVWLMRDEKMKWSLLLEKTASSLIDIGDYDGDGKSEMVFFKEYDPPSAIYSLVSAESGQELAEKSLNSEVDICE